MWNLDFPRESRRIISFITRLRGFHIHFQCDSFLSRDLLRDSRVLSEIEAIELRKQGQEKTSELLTSQPRSFSFEFHSTDVVMVLLRDILFAHGSMVFDLHFS